MARIFAVDEKGNVYGALYCQRCPACGHTSTPDCEGHTCHRCGRAKYVDDALYLVREGSR
jgi:hypothetical protein